MFLSSSFVFFSSCSIFTLCTITLDSNSQSTFWIVHVTACMFLGLHHTHIWRITYFQFWKHFTLQSWVVCILYPYLQQITCNMDMNVLPDVYTQSPRGWGLTYSIAQRQHCTCLTKSYSSLGFCYSNLTILDGLFITEL